MALRLASGAVPFRYRRHLPPEASLPDSAPSLPLRHYAEGAPVGLFGTDASGRTTWVNRRWSELAGIPVDAALGNGWLAAVHPADRASVDEGWRVAVGQQRPSTGDYRFLHADGRVVWVNGLARPDIDDDGNLRGYIGTITDITARVEAETLLAVQRDVLEVGEEASGVGSGRAHVRSAA